MKDYIMEQLNQKISVTSKSVLTYLIHNEYWKNKKMNHKCVYTCMTGGYDNIILHTYIALDYDYICFTDNKQLLQLGTFGAWQIRPLFFNKLSNQLNNRWHKLHPHICLKEYDSSIYVDSNVDILTPYYFNLIEERKNELIIMPCHYSRNCVFSELKSVYDQKKDSKENCKKIKKFLKDEKMPKHYGLTENNIIYRHHNEKAVYDIMEAWWFMLLNYSKRDQLSLSYCFWKADIKIEDITFPNARKDYKNFSIIEHK